MYNYPYGDNQQINLNWIISEIIALHQRLDPDYTAPTFTQIYPFSETQQLNLDWILTELKALKDLAPTPAPTEEIDEVGQALIAGAYDADTSYQKNDYIVQDGKVYRANAATTGTFDPTKWNEVMLGNDLAIITRWADATNTFLNSLAASNVANDSSVTGTTTSAALNNLNGALTTIRNQTRTVHAEYVGDVAIPASTNLQRDIITGINLYKGTYILSYHQTAMSANDRNTPYYYDNGRVYQSTATNRLRSEGDYTWTFTVDHDISNSSIGIWLANSDVEVTYSNIKLYALLESAFNELNGAINALSSDDIANNSTKISGATVTAALDALRDNIKTNTAWKNVSGSYGTLQAYYYESGTAITDYDLPENYVYVLCMQYKSTRGTAIAIRWQSGAYRMWINICHDTWQGWKQITPYTSIDRFTLTADCWGVWGPASTVLASYTIPETGFYDIWFCPTVNIKNNNQTRLRLYAGSTLVAFGQVGSPNEVRLPLALRHMGQLTAGTVITLECQCDVSTSDLRMLFATEEGQPSNLMNHFVHRIY